MAILSTLGTLALMIGFDMVSDLMKGDTSKLTQALNKITAQANSKSEAEINAALNQLQSIPVIASSPSITRLVRSAKRDMQKKYDDAVKAKHIRDAAIQSATDAVNEAGNATILTRTGKENTAQDSLNALTTIASSDASSLIEKAAASD